MKQFLLKHKLLIDIFTVVLFIILGVAKFFFWQQYDDEAKNKLNLFIGIILLAIGLIKGFEIYRRLRKKNQL